MFVEHITIQNFGAIRCYDADLTQELNLIESHHIDEIAAVVGFLLCNTPPLPEQRLQADTRISAVIHLEDTTYSVCAKPRLGQLQLIATDATGGDVTAQYQYALSHCKEQDEIESFDRKDKEVPLRLFRYRYREDEDDLSGRTERLADTNTFRRYLCQYTQDFRPEPINSKKDYLASINRQGKFEVILPGFEGEIHLSETEKRLFHYICFLNIAAQYVPYDHDRSYTPQEKQLLWRLEELEDRYHELITQKTGNRNEGVCFSEDNLRYVLPKHFLSAPDVRKAIDLAISDLKERYGIYVGDAPERV